MPQVQSLIATDDEQQRREQIIHLLELHYPGSARDLCELEFKSPFQLLVATVLSAQCTDKVVNSVTRKLFAQHPDAYSLAVAPLEEVEALVRPTGFYRNKSQNIIKLSKELVECCEGEVPREMDLLTSLPGVGRKTANVVLPIVYDVPGLAVDTHVKRLSKRLGFTKWESPNKVEIDLCSFIEPTSWAEVSLRLILHGRRICKATKPACRGCFLADLCPGYSIS